MATRFKIDSPLQPNNLVVINCTGDNLTSDQSGAIGTWVYETCLAAHRRSGQYPFLISRSFAHNNRPYPRALWTDYPRLPRMRLARSALHHVSRLMGYHHDRQWAYNRAIINAINSLDAKITDVMLHNDPELASIVKSTFPQLTVHHIFHNQNSFNRRFHSAFARVDYHYAVSGFTAEWLANSGLDLVTLPRIVHGGVDTSQFFPAPKDGLLTSLSFVGLTNEKKAPDVLLRAASILAARGFCFEIQLIGGPSYGSSQRTPYTDSLASLAEDLRNQGVNVAQLGYLSREELPDALRRSDINIVPSRWNEPFGLVALEAMASGCAIVATNVGGLPEIVEGAGSLFEVDDIAACAHQLEMLISNPQHLKTMKARALKRASQFTWDASWEALSTQWQDAYDQKESDA